MVVVAVAMAVTAAERSAAACIQTGRAALNGRTVANGHPQQQPHHNERVEVSMSR